MAEVRAHPRVFGFDSQAYGIAARQNARKARVSKTDTYLAREMKRWYRHQRGLLDVPGFSFRTPRGPARAPVDDPSDPFEARLAQAREEMRELHEAGEIEWSDLSPLRLLEWIALDELPAGADAPA